MGSNLGLNIADKFHDGQPFQARCFETNKAIEPMDANRARLRQQAARCLLLGKLEVVQLCAFSIHAKLGKHGQEFERKDLQLNSTNAAKLEMLGVTIRPQPGAGAVSGLEEVEAHTRVLLHSLKLITKASTEPSNELSPSASRKSMAPQQGPPERPFSHPRLRQ